MQYQLTQPARSTRWTLPSPPAATADLNGATRLNEGQFQTRIPSDKGLTVQCIVGALWITQTGSSADTVLRAGETFSASGSGKLIVQALEDSAVRID